MRVGSRVSETVKVDEEDVKGVSRRRWRWMALFLAAVLLTGFGLLIFGGRMLVAVDPLPVHADAAVVLEGSIVGEKVRLAGGMQLLQRNVTSRALVAFPPTSFWDEPVAPMARKFLENNYGRDVADRVDFCVVSPDVNSTLQEAEAIGVCIKEHHWNSIAVVTSTYHTRRAGLIWREVMRREDPSLQISMYGVPDPEFQAEGWWRKRLWAKTWLLECSKLFWIEIGGS